MNALERSLIEKAGYSNGWENVQSSSEECVKLFSARHKAGAEIYEPDGPNQARAIRFPAGPSLEELSRSFPDSCRSDGSFAARDDVELGRILRRAAQLAMSLPTHTADTYAQAVADVESSGIGSTEAMRLVKQRIGQDLYRAALMEYWSGACAVTGLAIPELLRASHAKPWAKCESDSERLDVFNGFLLTPNLDALFDAGLIAFDDHGRLLFSSRLTPADWRVLGLQTDRPFKLRWVSQGHRKYSSWHRAHIFLEE
jgi:putative restriction endonuclease